MKNFWINRKRAIIAVLVIAALAAAGAIGVKAETKSVKQAKSAEKSSTAVTVDQLPSAVAAAIKSAADGGAIQGIEAKTKKGATIYEASIVLDGAKQEIKVDASGKMIVNEKSSKAGKKEKEESEESDEHETKLTADQLPAAVLATLKQEAQGGPIDEIESEAENGATTFEADVIQGGVKLEVTIGADGKLLKKGPADEDDDDHEDGK